MSGKPCSACWNDERGVQVRDPQGSKLAPFVWVACGYCAPITPEKAERFVAAHRRVKATNAMLRREAQARSVK